VLPASKKGSTPLFVDVLMELIDKLKERFLKSPELLSQVTGDDERWNSFIQQYPSEQLSQLTIDEYCLGKNSIPENFSWWIERGLKDALGRYMPGSARGHLLYKNRTGGIYKHRFLGDLSDNEALLYVMKITQLIAQASDLSEAEHFDNDSYIYERLSIEPRVTMGDARKLRIFLVYHPDKIITINSPNHISHFLRLFGVDDSEIAAGAFARAQQLWDIYTDVRAEIPDLTPNGFAKLLYDDELGLKPDTRQESSATGGDETLEQESLPRNLILYGPPGTGKTYRTINRAVEILAPEFYRNNKQDRAKLYECFYEYKNQGHIGFVTFHQSFSYEEFVEGLKAQTDENNQIQYEIEDGVFKRMCDSASSKVTRVSERTVDLSGKRIWKMSLGNTQGEDAYIYNECIDNNYILLGYGWDLDFSGVNNKEEVHKKIVDAGYDKAPSDYAVTSVSRYIFDLKIGDLVVVTDGNHKFRAIGEISSDYIYQKRDDLSGYHQKRDIEWLRVYTPSRPYEDLMGNVFSQMTLYELKSGSINLEKLAGLLNTASGDFRGFQKDQQFTGYTIDYVGNELVRLIKPNGSSISFDWETLNELARLVKSGDITIEDIRKKKVFERVNTNLEKYIVNGYNNILAPMVELMTGDTGGKANIGPKKSNARVLIIDEINRGNISKIFGELITLIEADKRTGQPEALSVTLPYSKTGFSVPDNLFLIGTMNTADRSLTSIDAALRRRFLFEEVMPDQSLLSDINIEGIALSKVLQSLNQRIELLLGREYLIGHSYFLPLKDDPSLGRLGEIFSLQVIPLLKEYFFDDWEKIHRTLGDHQKPQQYQMVRRRYNDVHVQDLLGDDWQGGHETGWEVSENALGEPEAYLGIYQAITAT